MKLNQQNGFFHKIAEWFGGAKAGMRAVVIGGAAVVICGASAAVIVATQPQTVNQAPPSSEIDNVLPESSSQATVSEPASSEDISSEPISSEPVVSEAPQLPDAPSPQNALSSSELPNIAAAAGTASKTVAAPAAQAAALPEGYQESFRAAYQSNKNVMGQIYLAGTKLNYYVAKTTNNSYYINHSFYGAAYAWGNPFLDFRCSVKPSERYDNLVMYAHSDDKNGLQFSAIKKYKDLEFYKEHPTITFNTVYNNEEYKVVGMFTENVDMKNSFAYHNFLTFANAEEFDAYVNQVKGRSYISMPVDCEYGDKFITLSTCVSLYTKHSRYALVARRVRPDEINTVDVSLATVNANMIPASGPLN